MGNLTRPDNDKQLSTRQENKTPHAAERTISPKASVFETANEVVLELEMPGTSRDTIDVSVETDELRITARRVLPVDEGAVWLHQERLPYNYRRAFVLSDRIDTANIAASYVDGVLKLTLPKAAEAKPKKISIE